MGTNALSVVAREVPSCASRALFGLVCAIAAAYTVAGRRDIGRRDGKSLISRGLARGDLCRITRHARAPASTGGTLPVDFLGRAKAALDLLDRNLVFAELRQRDR
jgi:hypothetical protein